MIKIFHKPLTKKQKRRIFLMRELAQSFRFYQETGNKFFLKIAETINKELAKLDGKADALSLYECTPEL